MSLIGRLTENNNTGLFELMDIVRNIVLESGNSINVNMGPNPLATKGKASTASTVIDYEVTLDILQRVDGPISNAGKKYSFSYSIYGEELFEFDKKIDRKESQKYSKKNP